MPRSDPVGAIFQPSDSDIGENDRLDFIHCVGGRHPEIHKVWTFGEHVITPEVHPFAHVDVGAFVRDCFATDYLNENGRRVPMFERKSINGSFEWMGIPDFLRTDGPPWYSNLLDPYVDWKRRGTSTSLILSSGY